MQLQQQKTETSNLPSLTLAEKADTTAPAIVTTDATLRVTAEEIALAVAALEAKREAEHARRQTTLPLQEAIDHLSLNTTPEELAEEVVTLRAEKQQREQVRQLRRKFGMSLLSAIGIGAAIIFCVAWLVSVSRNAPRVNNATMTTLPMQKLSIVPDNQVVHIDADTLAKLATGEVALDKVSVDTRIASSDAESRTMFNNEWEIVRSQGVLQVRGWTTADLALNITNNATGSLYSGRPEWLPANNLLPMQVPVYRLEGQQFAQYEKDGKIVSNVATSVLMAVNVVDAPTAIEELVANAILPTDENFISTARNGWSHVTAKVIDNVVHLSGNATDMRLKNLAGEVAARIVKDLPGSYTVSNDLVVAPNE